MRTHEEDTAGPCSFASFVVSSKVLSDTSHDASEEVSVSRAASDVKEFGIHSRLHAGGQFNKAAWAISDRR